MITGTVFNRCPLLTLMVRGPKGQSSFETVVDTGFNGFLTLPPANVAALALPFRNYFYAGLADGSRVKLEVYAATVLWDGEERNVEVLSPGREPLLGTALRDGHDLSIRFTDGRPRCD